MQVTLYAHMYPHPGQQGSYGGHPPPTAAPGGASYGGYPSDPSMAYYASQYYTQPAAPINPYRMAYGDQALGYGAGGGAGWNSSNAHGSASARPSGPPETYTCHKCGIKGHWVTECPAGNAAAQGSGSPLSMRGHSGGYSRGRNERNGMPGDRGGRGERRGRGGMGESQGWDRGQRQGYGMPGRPPPRSYSGQAHGGVAEPVVADESSEDEGVEGGDGPAPFSCEPCEKDFHDEAQYKTHVAAHERCMQPRCTFMGSKRVVVAHYRLLHGKYKGSGFRVFEVEGRRYRILVGNKPEDVEQWREDRRKHFPTRENVEKRRQFQQQQRMQRQQHQQGRVDGHDVRKRSRDGLVNGPSQPAAPSEQHMRTAKVAKLGDADSANAAAPLMGLVACYGSDDEDNEGALTDPSKSEAPQVQGTDDAGGAAVVAAGGVSAHNGHGADVERPRSVMLGVCRAYLRGLCQEGNRCRYRHGPRRTNLAYCRYFTKPGGTCGHGDNCRFVHDVELKAEYEAFVTSRRAGASRDGGAAAGGHDELSAVPPASAGSSRPSGTAAVTQLPRHKPRPGPSAVRRQTPTLLKRLLGLEKEKETQLMLEAIRFLVTSNFFKKNVPPAIETSTNGGSHGVTVQAVDEASSEEE